MELQVYAPAPKAKKKKRSKKVKKALTVKRLQLVEDDSSVSDCEEELAPRKKAKKRFVY